MALGVIQLDPCPFCEGPPVVLIRDRESETCLFHCAPLEVGEFPDEGALVEGYVFCHECGAQGPVRDGFVYDAESLAEVAREVVELWQNRNVRHRDLYEAGHLDGLNLFPRPHCDRDPGDEHPR
jgi:hypothetical protein